MLSLDEEHSTATLDLPNLPNIHPTFHTSKVLPFAESDATLFSSHKSTEPLPIITSDNQEEYYIDKIINARQHSHEYQHLVCWKGYGQEHDRWLPGSKLQDCQALNNWLASQN
jgi:hypothetical protein